MVVYKKGGHSRSRSHIPSSMQPLRDIQISTRKALMSLAPLPRKRKGHYVLIVRVLRTCKQAFISQQQGLSRVCGENAKEETRFEKTSTRKKKKKKIFSTLFSTRTTASALGTVPLSCHNISIRRKTARLRRASWDAKPLAATSSVYNQ